jgi:hypothetical protein
MKHTLPNVPARSRSAATAIIVAVALVTSALVPTSAEAAQIEQQAGQLIAFRDSMTAEAPLQATPSARTEAVRAAAEEDAQTMSGGVVDRSDVVVLENGDGLIVREGLRGSGLEPISNRAVFFDRDGRRTTTVEYAFRADGAGGGSLDVWQDHELRYSNAISKDRADAVLTAAERASKGFWAKLNDCLSKQNVNAWALAILAGVCGAACVATAGTACAVCIGATIGFPSGVVTSCIAMASR